MDSRRKKYFKKVTNLEEKELERNERKRKLTPNEKNNSNYVTKLRHVTTADYESINSFTENASREKFGHTVFDAIQSEPGPAIQENRFLLTRSDLTEGSSSDLQNHTMLIRPRRLINDPTFLYEDPDGPLAEVPASVSLVVGQEGVAATGMCYKEVSGTIQTGPPAKFPAAVSPGAGQNYTEVSGVCYEDISGTIQSRTFAEIPASVSPVAFQDGTEVTDTCHVEASGVIQAEPFSKFSAAISPAVGQNYSEVSDMCYEDISGTFEPVPFSKVPASVSPVAAQKVVEVAGTCYKEGSGTIQAGPPAEVSAEVSPVVGQENIEATDMCYEEVSGTIQAGLPAEISVGVSPVAGQDGTEVTNTCHVEATGAIQAEPFSEFSVAIRPVVGQDDTEATAMCCEKVSGTIQAGSPAEVPASDRPQEGHNSTEMAGMFHEETSSNTIQLESLHNIDSRTKEIEICIQEIRNDCEINNSDNSSEVFIVIEPLDEEKTDTINKSNTERKEKKLKHLDFLSEDECFEWSSSSWEPEKDDTIRNKKVLNKKKQPKKRKPRKQDIQPDSQSTPEKEDKRKKVKKINKYKERSRLKNLGQEYVTKTGKQIEAKQLKENPCRPGKCKNNCFDITEERRLSIFKYYWNLSKERRRDWIISHSLKEKVKRKRTSMVNSRREYSTQYFINDSEGQKRVCLQFLLNTLDIRQRFVHFIIENAIQGASKDDNRGKHIPPNKTNQSLMQSVRSYFEELPAVPAHYCRKESKKLYLPQEFKNLSNLYRIYKETKQSEGTEYVGEKVFKSVFNSEFNISFHVPRKDKCVKCIKYENDQSGQFISEKELHLKDKEETYARFKVHQEANKHDPTILCTTFDLQKVLNTPYGPSMLLYYSMKLAVYNLTFYESQTREGFCYTWNEAQAKRGANEICTILSKYIKKVDSRGNIKHLLLYCDSCPGQNKNRVVLACLSECLKKCVSITSIQINYLLPGHTFMPVDSMHSVIEKSVTNSIIWAPSQWSTVFALARKSPKPYEVETLTYTDFEGWDSIADRYFRGNLMGKVSKIRTVTFKKSSADKIYVKYSMGTDAEGETIDIIAKNTKTPKPVYKAQLPISNKKYAHLMKLCSNKTIPEQYHNEYKNLPKAANVKDVLPESDIEDAEE